MLRLPEFKPLTVAEEPANGKQVFKSHHEEALCRAGLLPGVPDGTPGSRSPRGASRRGMLPGGRRHPRLSILL